MQQSGFSLIEVLVSLLLLSLMLLGFDAMEIYALKQSRVAFYYSAAEQQLNNMRERLLSMSAQHDVETQLAAWNEENKTVLPQGFGSVQGEFPHYITTIFWGKMPHRCGEIKVGESGCLKEKVQLESR